jgi:DNA-binding transcriptional LysR family regulator
LSVSMLEPPGVLSTLRAGDIDLAVCNDDGCLSSAEVEGQLLFEEPMRIALPRAHRLAGRSRVRLGELAQERWMLGTNNACPDAARFIRACHAEGFDPQIAFHNDDYTAVLGFVAAGVGVAPVPEMVARNASADVRICTVRGLELTRPIVAVMPAGYQSRPARAMLDVLQDVSAQWHETGRTLRSLRSSKAA